MESTDSSGGPQLPPGFRFHPTDEELVVHYLKKKAASAPLPVAIIAEVDLYKFDPWELPAKATFGEQEWYFFSPRDRKYPNGARPNRAATSGYWKATGTDKPVLTAGGTQRVGVKKALVFYGGKPPKGVKTNWIMHEYRLADSKSVARPPGCDVVSNKKASLRLDDWVLCRIYKKNNSLQRPMDHQRDRAADDMFGSFQASMLKPPTTYASLMDTDHHHHHSLYGGIMAAAGGSKVSPAAEALPLLAPDGNLPSGGKRSVSNLYWNEEENHDESGNSPASTKRFLTERWHGRSGEETTNSIATILSQIPQTPSLQEQPMLGAYQVSGMNWYT